MPQRKSTTLVVLALLFAVTCVAACAAGRMGRDDDDDDGAAGAGNGNAGGTDPSTGGQAAGGGGSSAVGGSSAGGTSPQGGSGGSGGCYSEGYDLGASLADLQAGYQQSQWLPTMLAVLDRRYDNGHQLLYEMQYDPWLQNDFPLYFDLSTWAGLMESVDTACHEETHGWDFETALDTPGFHAFFMGDEQLTAAKLAFFARSEIVACVEDGGSVTSMYDQVYLTGVQGSYDFIFLADEVNAYTNGLACATSIGDQLSGGFSGRDGIAAQLLYLLCYLERARTGYAGLYAQWQGDADWQDFVRLAWARGRFWTEASEAFPGLGINDDLIWDRIDTSGLLVELEHFTGESATAIACNP